MAGTTFAQLRDYLKEDMLIAWERNASPYDDTKCNREISLRNIFCGTACPPGYPLWSSHEKGIIIFEGVCYGVDRESVYAQLGEIRDAFFSGANLKHTLRNFMDSHDGEYAVSIIQPDGLRGLFFNDPMGRLSLYWGEGSLGVSVSRELRHAAFFSGNLNIDRIALTDTMLIGFPLNERTLFKNIKLMPPGHTLTVSPEGVELNAILPLDFSIRDQYRTRSQALEDLSATFLKATRLRLETANCENRRILCDLSGGFDSRVMLGAIPRFFRNVDYITFQYVQDESIEGKAAFEAVGSPGTYRKLKLNNCLKKEGLSRLLLQTDGLVNYYTTGICFNDLDQMRSMFGPESWRFGGLGGEFIRHPYINWSGSIIAGAKNPIYAATSLANVTSLTRLDEKAYVNIIRSEWPATDRFEKQTALRKYYYNYYMRYVGHAGGERERGQLWPVHPLWAREYVTRVFTRVPLEWTGFNFFARFIKLVDPRLITVPIYGKGQILDNPFALNFVQTKYNLKQNSTILRNSLFRTLYRSFSQVNSNLDEYFSDFSNQISELQEKVFRSREALFKIDGISITLPLQRRMISLLMFFDEFEQQYNIQIHV